MNNPRKLGWLGTACIAMGGSNQSLILIGPLLLGESIFPGQGSIAIVILIAGLLISMVAIPGWLELTLMYPNRVGGVAATCVEAFRPYSEVLATLAGVCYWCGWVTICGVCACAAASAIQSWYLPGVTIPPLAILIVLIFTWVNLRGIRFASMVAIPIASISAFLALLSGLIPILTGQVNWDQATTFNITSPFEGLFGEITSFMSGLYIIGFASHAFGQATCHVGELKDPVKDQPRILYTAAFIACFYFIFLPVVWLGVFGTDTLSGNLRQILGPTFAPVFGVFAKAAAIWFVVFNLSQGTLAALAGSTRTLSQLADDGLLPHIFSLRTKSDAPAFAILFTAAISILFLWLGEPLWLVAATNFSYLIGISLPSIAVWLLRRDQPNMLRPWQASTFMIWMGIVSSFIWMVTILLGFEQFGIPTVLTGVGFVYFGVVLYLWRKISDRIQNGLPAFKHTLHLKLTVPLLLVLALDAAGYLIAVQHIPAYKYKLITILSDIFVLVAILSVTVGLVLPGIIANSVALISKAANRLTHGTVSDFKRAMEALGKGNIEDAYANIELTPVIVHSRDEVGELANNFNLLQSQMMESAKGLNAARDALSTAYQSLIEANQLLLENQLELVSLNTTLEDRVQKRTLEIQSIQQELVTSARQAGMAEVASNVLHNVGNILNSVNVSASIIAERITHSKLKDLEKISKMINDNKNNLKDFFTADTKGLHFPDYLAALASYQKVEQNEISKELALLVQNIDHIKNIVTMQQSLSGIAGLEQLTNLSELLEDALKVSGLDINSEGIIIIREYTDVEACVIDKSRVLQICINLIKNAKDALNASSNSEKKLILSLYQNDDGKCVISVADNGIGIAPENMTKIFAHGYTSKKSGHGFGLHSSALAAQEMKGSLTVRSGGRGKGATFILELPYKCHKK